MSLRQPRKRRPTSERNALLNGIPGALIPKEKQARDRVVKDAEPEAIIQNLANDYLRMANIPFTHYSARVLSKGDESISGDPDNMIRLPIKGTPFCLMLNIEFKKKGKDRRPNQVRKAPSYNSALVDDFKDFEKLMIHFNKFHGELYKLLHSVMIG